MPTHSRSRCLALWGIVLLLAGCGVSGRSSGGNGAGLSPSPVNAQNFSCPFGQTDVMQYFAMGKTKRDSQFMNGQPNPIYTQVFPDQDQRLLVLAEKREGPRIRREGVMRAPNLTTDFVRIA